MDLFRALFLVIGICVLEKLDFAHSQNDKFRKCQYIPHLYDTTQLKGKVCLQSQMADESRYALQDILNTMRSNVAKGVNPENQTHANVFKLKYHWACEYFATRLADTISGEGLQTGTLEKENVTAIVTGMRETILKDEAKEVGSIGTATLIDVLEWTYASFSVAQAVPTQSALIEYFGKHLVSSYDSTSKNSPVYPGTSYFGCAVRINVGAASKRKRQSSTTSLMVCVFATRSGSDKEYTDGKMTADTCKSAKPEGTFDAKANLCVDRSQESANSYYDMPCQFFYANVSGGSPPAWMKMSCEGADFDADMLFKGLKEDTQVIYGNNKIMVAAYDDSLGPGGHSATDAALKLHSIPAISLIIFIASISAIFSQS